MVRAWDWRDKQEWYKIARLGCWSLCGPLKKLLTPEQLMGPDFFEEIVEKKFKTEEDWKKHKENLKRRAKYFEGIYKEIKSGKRKPVKVVNFGKRQSKSK